ncbi:hypothetical protein BT96DRAFT_923025 [Gymnopus androsaceus JB14]|uniref:Alpha/beta-hydrolase n=1 Tax=Gymnopus androsaceus JB14 TaxID=1447944 RepID=A0A6A4HBS7_9AGAR|nr:hypothetical protein BT96DRAFT_923025 [Gymnopus androsaceus JB14]
MPPLNAEKATVLSGIRSGTPTSLTTRWLAFAVTCALGLLSWRRYSCMNNSGDSSVLSSEADFDWYKLEPSENITWTDCFDKFQCARLSLPLDYSPPKAPRLKLPLSIIQPPTKPITKARSFLIPGHSRNSSVLEFAILGFDPRGTGATTPAAQCFDSDSQFRQWNLQSQAQISILRPDDNSFGQARSREDVFAARCLKALGGNGKEELNGTAKEWGPGRFMATNYVVEDMVNIMEKLGQEKMLYWGFSYGSVLGQYFSAIYPEKVGRVIIDGVYNAEEYRAGLWSSNMLDTDHVASSFYEFCYQGGPHKCAVYEPTPERIQQRIENIFSNLTTSPLPVPFAASGPALITSGWLRNRFFRDLYSPVKSFPVFADAFYALETGNQTAIEAMADVENEAFYTIACGDTGLQEEQPGQLEEHYKKLVSISSVAGAIWSANRLRCLRWKFPAKERYEGPFSANTSHPLLVINPTYDTVCPLADAKAVQKRYVGAGLLEQNSNGHCSVSAPSVCTGKVVKAYFNDGVLPDEGKICQPDVLPFVGDVGANVMSVEDLEMLETMKELMDVVPTMGLSERY